jgi:hypothetical protein
MKIFILFFIFIFTNSIVAQYYLGYTVQNATLNTTYNELTDAIVSSATGDDGAENINLPFTINYMGVNYSTARISVNGWLELGQSYTGPGNNNNLASTISKPLLCPLWDDLFDDVNSEIRYKTTGISPDRIFTVEWKNISFWSYRKSFQVKLYEIDGTIEFSYGQQTGDGFGISASIGVNDHIGGINHFISITPSFPFTVDTTVANNSIDSFEGIQENTSIFFVQYGKELYVQTVQVTEDVVVGSVNQPIISILISSRLGVLTMPSVVSISLSTNGTTNTTDILNAKLFSTGRNPNFSTLYQSGPTFVTPNGNFTINGGAGLYDYSTNYIWLTYDVAENAQIGNVLDGESLQLNFSLGYPQIIPTITAPNGNRVVVPGNGLAGAYTVGSDGDFNSLTAIVDSLTETYLTGSLTIELLSNYNSGTEVFPINIPYITGISAQNRVTIRPAIDASNIVIEGNSDAIIILDGGTYISLDGRPGGIVEEQALSIINENQNGAAILITGNSRNIGISNSKILGCSILKDNGVIQSSYNGYYSYSDSITITYCLIGRSSTGRPAIGIYFGEGDYPVAKNWIIENCTITDFTDAGIKIDQANLTYIQDSEIFLTAPTNSDTVVGVIINPYAFTTRILRNFIHSLLITNNTNNYVTGIQIPFTENISVYNNFISLAGNEFSTITGIDFNGEYYTFNNFNNNSIIIYGNCINSSNSYCFRRRSTQYYSGLYLRLLNNILINNRSNVEGTGHHYSISIDDQRGLQLIDHNDYFISGNGGVLGRWLNQDIFNLTDWKVVTQKDSFSVSKEIFFISDTNLHLTGSSLGDADLIGEPISVIPNDIDMETRNLLFPYIGADENLEFPLPVELFSFKAFLQLNTVELEWSTATETNNQGFEILRATNDTEWNKIGFVPGYGSTTETKQYYFTDNDIKPSKYQYKLKQMDYNGTFNYSPIVEVEIPLVHKYSLEQNYPNPFNPITTIKYEVPEKNFIMVKVYDVLGNEIATLINVEKASGSYEVVFDGSRLPSGIYFYKIQAGDFSATKKMILLK